jgi:hypothetical protein
MDTIIPACSKLRTGDSGYQEYQDDTSLNILELNKRKFYGSCTSLGAKFPVIVKAQPPTSPTSPNGMAMHYVKIMSIPTIAGLVTIRHNGIIQSINSVPAKYLFGYSQEDLVDKKNISELLPQLPTILKGLEKEFMVKNCNIIDYHSCRRILLEREQSPRITKVGIFRQSNVPHNRKPTTTCQDKTLPVIHAVHRDGTRFEVQLQLRMMEIAEEELIALWITFDRVSTFSKYGHISKIGTNNLHMGGSVSNYPTVKMRSSISTPSESRLLKSAAKSTIPALLPLSSVSLPEEPSKPEQKMALAARPELRAFGVSSFGSANIDKKVMPVQEPVSISVHPTVEMAKSKPALPTKPFRFPSNIQPNTPPPARTPPISLLNYSALTLKTNISDYCIMDSLGQGAYGMVKLAYKFDDPEKVYCSQ